MGMPKIVAATDFSADADRAVARAGRLADELGAALELVHVVGRHSLEDTRKLPGIPVNIRARILREARHQLEQLKTLVPSPVPVTTIVKIGVPTTEIRKASTGSDLLVLGVRGTNPVRDLLLGTTAERILNKARIPILIVRCLSTGPYQRVLAPVDFSAHSQRALESAARVSPAGTITALNAYVVPFEGHLRQAGTAEEQILSYRMQASVQALKQLDALLKPLSSSEGRWQRVAVHGDPTPVILDMEEQMQADLIVIAKHGRSILADVLIGSVTRRTIADAHCDVLVVPSSS